MLGNCGAFQLTIEENLSNI